MVDNIAGYEHHAGESNNEHRQKPVGIECNVADQTARHKKTYYHSAHTSCNQGLLPDYKALDYFGKWNDNQRVNKHQRPDTYSSKAKTETDNCTCNRNNAYCQPYLRRKSCLSKL